jgi:hypothetical protein
MRAPKVLTLVVVMLVGCETASSAPAVEVLDSAGVRVVVNPPPHTADPVFRLSPEPNVVIGAADDPDYQLFRVTGGTVLADGAIVIANSGTQELRFYDDAGAHLRTAGRQGQGPGEFSSLGFVGAFRDSLVVFDTQLKRFSVFDTGGAFARSFTPPDSVGRFYTRSGVLGDGRLVVLEGFLPDMSLPAGVQRPPRKLSRVGADGTGVALIGSFPGGENYVIPNVVGMGVVFGRGLHADARGDRIAVGNDDAYGIRVYDGEGALLHVVRQTREPVPVQPGDFERGLPPPFRPGAPPNFFSERSKPAIEQMTRHTTFPAYGYGDGASSSLRFDTEGNLWVAEYTPLWVETTSLQAFDHEGVFVGRLDLPARFRVLDIGADWILGRTQDELDVERVVLYGLERPAPAR